MGKNQGLSRTNKSLIIRYLIGSMPNVKVDSMDIWQALDKPAAATVVSLATTLITLLGIIAALLGIWWQSKRTWRLNSANLVTQLDDRFNSGEWRRYRAHCARLLLEHLDDSRDLNLSESFPVLGFFEHIGYLARTKVVDRRMLWNKFGWFVVGYYLAITSRKDAIKHIRRADRDHTLWVEVEWFYNYSVQVYKTHKVDLGAHGSQEHRIKELLKWESSLMEPLK